MARYIARVRTERAPADTFTYMADLRNFEEWDPGVVRSIQVEGDGPGPGAVYDVTVDNGGRQTTLRYRVTDYDAPQRVKVVGETRFLLSVDEITVEAGEGGTVVTYDAELTLKGPLRLADPLLRPLFDKIGDKAAEGLTGALDGTRVETS